MLSLRFKNNLYRNKFFWSFKQWLANRVFFPFWKFSYGGYDRLGEQKRDFQILWHSLRFVFIRFLYGVFLIALFESFNYFFPLSESFKGNLDAQAIDTTLAAIASFSGVFLGLYFAAVSAIAGSLLLKATDDLRDLFLTAKAGQRYIGTLVMTGVVSVFYMLVKSFGHTIHPVGLVFLTILAAYAVIRFWTIGTKTFHFIQSSESFFIVTSDIARASTGVTPSGFQWQIPVIQNHYKRLATRRLQTLKNLVNFGIEVIGLSEEQLILSSHYMSGLLIIYSDRKREIPTKSLWYKTKDQFQNWLLASSTEIIFALNSGAPLAPKNIQNSEWFEDEVMETAIVIQNFFAEKKKLESLISGMDSFVSVSELYGRDFDIPAATLLFKKLDVPTALIYDNLLVQDHKQPDLLKAAFADCRGRLAISALLGFTKFIDSQSKKQLTETISSIDWLSDSSIYKTGLPLKVLPTLESLKNDLVNEHSIEGKIVSPEWYIETLCVQRYLTAAKDFFDYIKSFHANYFEKQTSTLLAKKEISMAMQFIERWREFSNKHIYCVAILKKHFNECQEFHKVKDLPWPSIDFENEKKLAEDWENKVNDQMISLIPQLKTLERAGEVPDYFGEAYTFGIEICYQACAENDYERFNRLFPIVFSASLTAYDDTRKQVEGWTQESQIIFSSEPLIELLEVSGYAKIYSQLYQDEKLWETCKSVWDIYLESVSAKEVIQWIVTLARYRDTRFLIMPKAIIRTSWEMKLRSKLQEQGFPATPLEPDFPITPIEITHPSLLIRMLGRRGGLMSFSARDIFFVEYLEKHPAAPENMEFPDRHNLKGALEREGRINSDENPDE